MKESRQPRHLMFCHPVKLRGHQLNTRLQVVTSRSVCLGTHASWNQEKIKQSPSWRKARQPLRLFRLKLAEELQDEELLFGSVMFELAKDWRKGCNFCGVLQHVHSEGPLKVSFLKLQQRSNRVPTCCRGLRSINIQAGGSRCQQDLAPSRSQAHPWFIFVSGGCATPYGLKLQKSWTVSFDCLLANRLTDNQEEQQIVNLFGKSRPVCNNNNNNNNKILLMLMLLGSCWA